MGAQAFLSPVASPLDSPRLGSSTGPPLLPISGRTAPRSPASGDPITSPASQLTLPKQLPSPLSLSPPRYRRPHPPPKPKTTSSAPRGRRPHNPFRTSICPPGHPTRDPTGGHQSSAQTHPLSRAPSAFQKTASPRRVQLHAPAPGRCSRTTKATPRSPLHWLPAQATVLGTCSVAPRDKPAGDDFLLPALGVGAVPDSPA